MITMAGRRSRYRRLVNLLCASLVAALGSVAPASATGGHHHGDAPRAARYVALGDSYSSGEGTGIYFRATDTTANRCHRSPSAYAPLLADDNRRLRPLSFVACSRAQTRDLYRRNHAYSAERPQLAALTRRTKVVTLTIGGNDVGFVEVLGACVHTQRAARFGCSTNASLNAVVQARTAALAGAASVPGAGNAPVTAVRTVLADIAVRAPRARIYLAGYPELFGDHRSDFRADPSAPSRASCVVNSSVGARVDYADAQWLNQATRRLNATLRAAVQQARAAGARVTYVSPARFDGHGLCDARTSWIRPLLLTETAVPRPESFHPTPRGYRRGYAAAFADAGL